MAWSRTWMLKAATVNLISRLPFHEHIHFFGQKVLGRQKLDATEMFRRALELFRLLRHVGGSVQESVVLEIGTGWFPFLPILAFLAGAARVITVDIHPWLTRKNTLKTVDAVSSFLEAFAQKADCNKEMLKQRYDLLRNVAHRAPSLNELLIPLGIRYLCPYDITENEFEDNSIDVIFSSNVLEHVPPHALLDIHRETARVLSESGLAMHRLNPGDHFHPLTGSTINFLKCDEKVWRFLGGYGLSYHNRLRSCEHADLVKNAGLCLAFWADSLDERAISALKMKQIALSARFAGMPTQFLCAYYSWLVARKAEPSESVGRPAKVKWVDEILDKRQTTTDASLA